MLLRALRGLRFQTCVRFSLPDDKEDGDSDFDADTDVDEKGDDYDTEDEIER